MFTPPTSCFTFSRIKISFEKKKQNFVQKLGYKKVFPSNECHKNLLFMGNIFNWIQRHYVVSSWPRLIPGRWNQIALRNSSGPPKQNNLPIVLWRVCTQRLRSIMLLAKQKGFSARCCGLGCGYTGSHNQGDKRFWLSQWKECSAPDLDPIAGSSSNTV